MLDPTSTPARRLAVMGPQEQWILFHFFLPTLIQVPLLISSKSDPHMKGGSEKCSS